MTDYNEDKKTETPEREVERPMVGNQHRYLDEFLNATPKVEEAKADTPELEGESLDDRILDAIRQIYDPEIPVNIYDLGLIYDCNIDDDNNVEVIMTLTTPHCPVAETMPGEVEYRVAAVPGVQSAVVRVVWDPPWDPSKMSEEAKLELGFL